jgi:hypothetical protein
MRCKDPKVGKKQRNHVNAAELVYGTFLLAA